MREALARVRRDPGLQLVLVALVLVVALYVPALDRGLTNYDDPWLYTNNFVVQHASLDSLRTIFFDVDIHSPGRWALAPEYLPVRDLSVMLDYAVWGDWYGGFHLTSLVLYLVAIPLWFATLVGFGVDRRIAGVAILLWALHPSHAESVVWLSERKGLLGAMWAGAAGLGYTRFRAGRPTGWLVFAAIATVAAVWSKGPAAFYIAALGGLELVLPATRRSWRRSLTGLGVLAVAGGLAFVPVLIMASQAVVVGGDSAVPGSRAATVLGVHGFYLQVAAMAVPNAVTYPIASSGPSGLQIALGALGLAALVASAVRIRGRGAADELRAAAAVWLFGWLPVSHLILPLNMVAVADRYAMLMSLGFALAAAAALVRIPARGVRTVAVAALVVLAAVRSYDAQSKWASSILLWERAAESDPSNAWSWSMLAEALTDAGRPDLAQAEVTRGLAHTQGPRLLLRQAVLLAERGDRAGARPFVRRAADGGEPRAMSNLALLELEDGKLDDALAWARRGAAADPQLAHTQRTRGKVALAAHQLEEAYEAFRVALRLESAAPNRLNLALALLALDRAAEAIPLLEATAADPALGARARALLVEARRRAAPVR